VAYYTGENNFWKFCAAWEIFAGLGFLLAWDFCWPGENILIPRK